jgi:hypothetical protein
MFYCIEFQVVLKMDDYVHVRKLIVYKRTPWKGYQIAKLNITTHYQKTTFKKFYSRVDAPDYVKIKHTWITQSLQYNEFVNIYSPLIKLTKQVGLAQ